MIHIKPNLELLKISISDQKGLFQLMSKIYFPEYKHLWIDEGVSYIEQLYSIRNLELDLKDPKSNYFFVQYKSEIIGILRFLNNSQLIDAKDKTAIKLQRIYLDQAVQGKGIGKILISWMEKGIAKKIVLRFCG